MYYSGKEKLMEAKEMLCLNLNKIESDAILLDYYNKNYKHFDNIHESFLYCIYNPLNNLYKIGRTRQLKERLNHLSAQAGIDFKLHCYKYLDQKPYGTSLDKDQERFLHHVFTEKRVKGEWFSLNKKDLIFLDYFFNNLDV
jgi:hypothetical protein